MKDSRNILLLVVSLCLVGTWIYHLYDKNHYAQEPAIAVKKDSVTDQTFVNDSLRLKYSAALSQLDSTRKEKDSLLSVSSVMRDEVDSLRNEISAILTNKNSTKGDLQKAEEKIKQLQQKMTSTGNQSKTTEVKTGVAGADLKGKPEIKNTAQNVQETPTAFLSAVNISLKAMQAEARDQSTTKAVNTGYFAVSCQLQNSSISMNDTEVYMVLTDPKGNVIQDDQWQAGMFLSGTNGRIPYSRKSSFSYVKGDNKRITANIKPNEVMPGSYSLQIYHNGARIGKVDLRLN